MQNILKNSDYKRAQASYNDSKYSFDAYPLFDNLPELIKIDAVADMLGLKVSTIYGWKYQSKTRNIPNTLFIKVNSLVYLRTKVLRDWIISKHRR